VPDKEHKTTKRDVPGPLVSLDPLEVVGGTARVNFAKLSSDQRLALVRARIDKISPNFVDCPGFVPLAEWKHWFTIGLNRRQGEIHIPVKRLRGDVRDPSKNFLGVGELFTEFDAEFRKSGRIDELVVSEAGNFGILSAVYAVDQRPGKYFYQATECTFRIIRDQRLMEYLDNDGYLFAHGIIMKMYEAVNNGWHNLRNALAFYEDRMKGCIDAWHMVN
jgi:hypothetical protein